MCLGVFVNHVPVPYLPYRPTKACNRTLNSFSFPVVIKPLNLSASRGVIRANNKQELQQAIEKVIPVIQAEEVRLI